MNVNELFEKVKEGAQTAGEFAARTATQAGKKAGEMFNTSKHQITIFDIKNDINDLYKEIGALVYATHKNGDENSEQIDEKLNAIDEKMERIEELKTLIDEIKDAKSCPSCGARMGKDDEFCRKCGTKL